MQTNTVYKKLAVAALGGKWAKAAIATLIYYFVVVGISIVLAIVLGSQDASAGVGNALSNIVTVLLLPLAWGYAVYCLNISRGQSPAYGELFDGFRQGYVKYLGTLFLQGIYTILWMLLLIVPGIVKNYSYSMTSFVMKDNPTLKYNAAIEESMRLMKGHKMQLFLLDLSMIGWFILSCLTLGIGFLFLTPYNTTAHAAFYEDLIASQAVVETEVDAVVVEGE